MLSERELIRGQAFATSETMRALAEILAVADDCRADRRIVHVLECRMLHVLVVRMLYVLMRWMLNDGAENQRFTVAMPSRANQVTGSSSR